MRKPIPTPAYPQFLSAIAHEIRWRMLMALASGDLRAQELAQYVVQPQNLVSYHLRQLRDAELVMERRSSADRRDVYYSLNLDRLHALYQKTGQALHPLLGIHSDPPTAEASTYPRLRVLFLCTHNSARSQMAEGLLRHVTRGQLQVESAGTEIALVHPYAVEVMAQRGVDISRQRSKHIQEVADHRFDYVITVCDRVREVCPTFPNEPINAHWSLADPRAAPEDQQYALFQETANQLRTRINHFLLTVKQESSL